MATRKRPRHEKPPTTPHQMQKLDLQIALSIAGFAGIETRDRRGNINSDVWVRHSDKQSIGKLMEASDLKQLLMEQLRQQLGAQKDLLNECEEAEVGVNWILNFTQTWETKYLRKINNNFDISQRIVSAMHDGFFEVRRLLRDTPWDPDTIAALLLEARKQCKNALPEQEALVRFYYRNPETGPYMQRLAGKILQKKDVCNKAGGYSAKVQRNDITLERDHALRDFIAYIDDTETVEFDELINRSDLHLWLEAHWNADDQNESDDEGH